MSYTIRITVTGDLALFTRPEMKVERVSYDVITPSAARGVLEAIYWKPQIRWVVRRLYVFNPIRFTNLRRNEVASKASASTAKKAMKAGSGHLGLYVDEDRQQRAALMLRDVRYGIEATFDLLDREDPPIKHFEMFKRRAEKGQCFHRPYLGTRECIADFEWVDEFASLGQPGGPHESLAGQRDLGFMLHDIDYEQGRESRFFRAVMNDGVIDVPELTSTEVVG